MEIGGSNICLKDEPDQIRKGEGSAGDNDHHYIPGLPIERPMTSPSSYDSLPQQNLSSINPGAIEGPPHEALSQSAFAWGDLPEPVICLSPLAFQGWEWTTP